MFNKEPAGVNTLIKHNTDDDDDEDGVLQCACVHANCIPGLIRIPTLPLIEISVCANSLIDQLIIIITYCHSP